MSQKKHNLILFSQNIVKIKHQNFSFWNLVFTILSFRKKLGWHNENIMSFIKESHNENIKILHQKCSLNSMAIFHRVKLACRFWWTALLASTGILTGDGHSYDSPGKVQLFNFLSEYNRNSLSGTGVWA